MSKESISFALLPCPLCEYDLRATMDPRCPECGHAFDRAELLAKNIRTHPYLFEQYPRHNTRSFVRTWSATFTPNLFWRSLPPTTRPRIGRLILYWGISTVCLIAVSFPLGRHVFEYVAGTWLFSSRGRKLSEFVARFLYPLIAFIAWPWLTIAAANVFRATLRSGAVKQGHLVRWAVYTSSVNVVLFPLFTLVGMALHDPVNMALNGLVFPQPELEFIIGIVAIVPILWILLTIAYLRYLRLPNAKAMTMLTQVMVWLFLWAILSIFVP